MPPTTPSVDAIAGRFVQRRPLPGPLADLLALREVDPDAPGRLAAMVVADPDLSRRMRALGAQNPRLRPDEQRDVRLAMQRLTYRQIHCAAVGVVLLDALAGSLATLDFVAYWRRAAVVGSLAAAYATQEESEARDFAYTAGMLHQAGLLAIDAAAPDRLAMLLDAVAASGRSEAVEERVLGFTVRDVTIALLAGWQLPMQLAEALLLRDEPELSARRPVARALWEAVATADALGVDDPLAGTPPGRPLDASGERVIRRFFRDAGQLVAMAEGGLGLWMLGSGGAA